MTHHHAAHPKHTDQEYMIAALAGFGLFLLIISGILSAFGTVEDILGFSLTQVVWIGIICLLAGGALWLALLRPWESFDDLKTPYYTGHDHPEPDLAQHDDDLEIIEGIGPKAKQVLYEDGIKTFAQLAALSPEEIRAILKKAGLGALQPDTWPRQAKYVVDGDVEGFEAYKAHLLGGREKS